MNIDQNLHSLGLARTANQPRQRQDGVSHQHSYPFDCRRWAYGRRQDICPLPKGARPPRDPVSRLLLSRYAVIMLNAYNSNRDGFSAPHHPTA